MNGLCGLFSVDFCGSLYGGRFELNRMFPLLWSYLNDHREMFRSAASLPPSFPLAVLQLLFCSESLRIEFDNIIAIAERCR